MPYAVEEIGGDGIMDGVVEGQGAVIDEAWDAAVKAQEPADAAYRPCSVYVYVTVSNPRTCPVAVGARTGYWVV